MTTKLTSGNPELLQYAHKSMHITVLGGIKLTGLDRLRVTLKVVSTGDSSNAFRHNLDLYNSIQTTQVIERLADFSLWLVFPPLAHACRVCLLI
jgi:hypothetical protein